jgi:hypothetical protein
MKSFSKFRLDSHWLGFIVIAFALYGCVEQETGQSSLMQTKTAVKTATVVVTTTNNLPSPTTVINTPLPTPTTTKVIITQAPTNKLGIIDESISPDRRWKAIVSLNMVDGERRSIFTVANDGDKIEWVVEDNPFSDIAVGGGSFPVPYYWSKNGQYLYFTHTSSGDGCFAGGEHKGWDLQRLDLATGGVEQISPNGGSWISISPDESSFAYLVYAKQGITLRNIQTGEENTFDLLVQQEEVGMEIDQRYIVWSPDSNALVYVVMAGVCDFRPESYFNWLIFVDLKTTVQKILLEKDERGLVPISWVDENRILFRDGNQQLWWMNLETGEMISTK